MNLKIDLDKLNYINNTWLGNCFACSSTNHRGLNMKFFYDKEGISSYINLHKDFCGFEGIAHGGIIATILDEIGAWTIFALLKKIAVTQESNIKFLKPVFTNHMLKVEGRITEEHNSNITTYSIIKDGKDNILAECENKWLLVSAEILAKMSNININRINEMINRGLESL
ncbi:MAG: PaaI family thioesterase [Candidatus Lokiarchaeota archaeon]|nr:PaaI family thioesterase [Candidatus Lokiarchaeota archaeon]